MSDIERILTVIKQYQNKIISLESLQQWFQTLPLCCYFTAQQIQKVEELLDTIYFLTSYQEQYDNVIQVLTPIENYLECLYKDELIHRIEIFINGTEYSIDDANKIEGMLSYYYEDDEMIQDFITCLALYTPHGGDYLYSYADILHKAKSILTYIQEHNCHH